MRLERPISFHTAFCLSWFQITFGPISPVILPLSRAPPLLLPATFLFHRSNLQITQLLASETLSNQSIFDLSNAALILHSALWIRRPFGGLSASMIRYDDRISDPFETFPLSPSREQVHDQLLPYQYQIFVFACGRKAMPVRPGIEGIALIQGIAFPFPKQRFGRFGTKPIFCFDCFSSPETTDWYTKSAILQSYQPVLHFYRISLRTFHWIDRSHTIWDSLQNIAMC